MPHKAKGFKPSQYSETLSQERKRNNNFWIRYLLLFLGTKYLCKNRKVQKVLET